MLAELSKWPDRRSKRALSVASGWLMGRGTWTGSSVRVAQVGAPARVESSTGAEKLTRGGAACLVMRDEMVRIRIT